MDNFEKERSRIIYGDGPLKRVQEKLLRLSKAVSCDTKVQILLLLLSEEEKAVKEISEDLQKDITLISHHLADLRKLKMVKERRLGKLKLYSLTDETKEVLKNIIPIFEKEEN